VTATASAWEFEWACDCGRGGVISWAHATNPPFWDGAIENNAGSMLRAGTLKTIRINAET